MSSIKIVLLVGVLTSIVALVYSTPLPVAASASVEHASTEESGSHSSHEDKQTQDSSGAIKAAEDSVHQVGSSIASKLEIESISGQDDPLSSVKLDTKDIPLSVASDKLNAGGDASPSVLLGKLGDTGLATIGQQASPSALIGEVDTVVDTAASTISDKSLPLELGSVPALDSHDSSSHPSGEKAQEISVGGLVPGDGSLVATAGSVVSEVVQTSGGVSTNGAVEASGKDAQQTATEDSHNEQLANGQQTSSESGQHHTRREHTNERHGHRDSGRGHHRALFGRNPDSTARFFDNLRLISGVFS